MGETVAREVEIKEPGEGSLGAKIDRHQESRIYTGHPAEMAELGGSGEEEDLEKGSEEEATPPKEGLPSEPPKSEDFQPKHKTWEETEKARMEAERLAHERAEEAARAREEAEAVKLQLEEIQKGKKEPPKPPDATPEDQEAKLAELQEQIDDLDPYDPEYRKRRASLERQKFMVIAGSGGAPQDLDAIVDQKVETRLKAQEEARKKERENADRQERALKMAAAAGLDMKEGSWDRKQFWRCVDDAPPEARDSFENHVNWMIEEVKRDKQSLLGQAAPVTEEQPPKVHTENAVMERGGGGPPKPKTETYKPSSLGAALERHMERRIIR